MKVFLIAGARPNFMKIAPIWEEMRREPRFFEPRIIHTGQHYDDEMSRVFFRDLDLPEPDVHFGVSSGSHGQQTAKILVDFENLLTGETPDLVLVVGDVNSTLACALAAAKFRSTRRPSYRPLIAHVEAGLRSFDFLMPEEINRTLTDHLSDLLFTTCSEAGTNLKKEGIRGDRVFFVGNVMIDSLVRYRRKARRSGVLESLGLAHKGWPRPYALLTLHRPENVENPRTLNMILSAIKDVGSSLPVVFPIHPRTRRQIDATASGGEGLGEPAGSVILTDPLGYLDFLKLMMEARFVMTDSGGIQEETTVLGIPCLTLRETTERPVTVRLGTNVLCGVDPRRISREVGKILSGKPKRGTVPKFWDGRASRRIVGVLKSVRGKAKA